MFPGPFVGGIHRLRMERIDLLQLHRIDPAVPLTDQFSRLSALTSEDHES